MPKNDENVKEDITAVANVDGLSTDPIGIKNKTADKYTKSNKKMTLKKLKDVCTCSK